MIQKAPIINKFYNIIHFKHGPIKILYRSKILSNRIVEFQMSSLINKKYYSYIEIHPELKKNNLMLILL